MNFRDLEYLVAVADLGHFGQAAARCHVSQSALSLQLQKLEAELGVQLIERTSRRVVVAPAGRPLVERARCILQSRQELLDDAALEGGQMPATITLGLIPTIAPYQIGPVLKAMKLAYPETTLCIVEDITENLVQGTARGELDAAIIATDTNDSLIEETQLGHDELLLAVARTHPLAKRPRVEPKQLQNETMLLLKDGHCLSDQAVSFCTANSVGAAAVSIAASIHTLKSMICAGMGVTLIPRMAVDPSQPDKCLVFLPLKPTPSRTIRVITRKTSRLGPLLASALKDAMTQGNAGCANATDGARAIVRKRRRLGEGAK
jgi:LysR family transcriptional regulator, hydrogen peroxide-inducible genes activator